MSKKRQRTEAAPNVMYQPDQFIAALKDTGGVVKNAAQALGCGRRTFYDAIERYPAVKEALKEERETLKDAVEEKLIEQIMQGNMTAIIWYSKTQMKDRGYVERIESSGPDGGPIEVHELSDDELKERARTLTNRLTALSGANSKRTNGKNGRHG